MAKISVIIDAQQERFLYNKKYAAIGVNNGVIVDWHFFYTKRDAERYAEKRDMRAMTITQLLKRLVITNEGNYLINSK